MRAGLPCRRLDDVARPGVAARDDDTSLARRRRRRRSRFRRRRRFAVYDNIAALLDAAPLG